MILQHELQWLHQTPLCLFLYFAYSSLLKLPSPPAGVSGGSGRALWVAANAVPMPVSDGQQKCAHRKTLISISPQLFSLGVTAEKQ